MLAIETHELTRHYSADRRAHDVLALDRVSLTVERGEVRGLLGPNGAGKTTLVKLLSTVLLPSAGSARILGRDVVADTVAVRRRIGIVFGGDNGLYKNLSARDNLLFWAALYEVPQREAEARVERLLARVGLGERKNHLVRTFSRGMKHERIDFEGGGDELLAQLREHTGVASVERGKQGEGHRIELADAQAHKSVLALLFEHGVTTLRTSRPSLEEVYVHLIGDRGLEV